MFSGITHIRSDQTTEASENERLYQLHAGAATHEAVPIQVVMVHAVGRIHIGAKIEGSNRVHNHALFCEETGRKILFQRAATTGINPYAALGCWPSGCDIGTGVAPGDDPGGHDL